MKTALRARSHRKSNRPLDLHAFSDRLSDVYDHLEKVRATVRTVTSFADPNVAMPPEPKDILGCFELLDEQLEPVTNELNALINDVEAHSKN
jgi:hypothetical protein